MYEHQGYVIAAQNEEGPFTGAVGRAGFRDPAGRLPLGNRRNDAKYGNIEASVQTLRCFDNTLLGAPRQLVCQCCGMPLEDATTSHEPDGAFNEDYCKWCYTDGEFKYKSMDELIDFCASHMASEAWPEAQVRAHMQAVVPGLKHWKK